MYAYFWIKPNVTDVTGVSAEHPDCVADAKERRVQSIPLNFRIPFWFSQSGASSNRICFTLHFTHPQITFAKCQLTREPQYPPVEAVKLYIKVVETAHMPLESLRAQNELVQWICDNESRGFQPASVSGILNAKDFIRQGFVPANFYPGEYGASGKLIDQVKVFG